MYAKRPFKSPASVIEYLGRYTHTCHAPVAGEIAISNHRIKSVEDEKVTFSYKDYRAAAVKKETSLEGLEFSRRFAMHILPKGFVRIGQYGILSSTSKAAYSVIIKEQLPPLVKVKNAKTKRELFNPLKMSLL